MNKLEANYGNFASPAAASGLELSGPNSEVLQAQELIENARNIAFFGRVKNGIEKFADYTGSLGKKLMPRNLMLLGGIGTMAVAAACGGGSKENTDQVSAKPDAPAAPAVVRTIETTSTPAPAVKAEAPKPSTEVSISGPTEASKAKVREGMSGKLILISTEITAIQQPLYERDSLELHRQRQEDVAAFVKTINDSFARNDVEAARPVLLQLKDKIYAIGNPDKGVNPDKNLKAKHDPEDKYIKTNRVDPAVLPWYLAVVDMLVATDPTYNGK